MEKYRMIKGGSFEMNEKYISYFISKNLKITSFWLNKDALDENISYAER